MLKSTAFSLFLALNLFCFSAIAADYIPTGWIKQGSKPREYVISKDTQKSSPKVSNSLQIKGLPNADRNGFTTLMQAIKAKQFIGKRVRLAAKIKSHQLKGWAGLWMRIDGKDKNLGFDNMENRKITGTTNWKEYSIVLDISTGSEEIAFGVLTSGSGSIWIDSIRFEAVDKKVALTNLNKKNDKPANLDLK